MILEDLVATNLAQQIAKDIDAELIEALKSVATGFHDEPVANKLYASGLKKQPRKTSNGSL